MLRRSFPVTGIYNVTSCDTNECSNITEISSMKNSYELMAINDPFNVEGSKDF